MECKKCSLKFGSDSRFCSNCGKKLTKETGELQRSTETNIEQATEFDMAKDAKESSVHSEFGSNTRSWFALVYLIFDLVIFVLILSTAAPFKTTYSLFDNLSVLVALGLAWFVPAFLFYLLLDKVLLKRLFKNKRPGQAKQHESKNTSNNVSFNKQLIKDSRTRSERYSNRIRLVTALAVFIFGIYLLTPLSDFVSVGIGRWRYDGKIEYLAENSGFNTRTKSVFYRNNPTLVDADQMNERCPVVADAVEYGCYLHYENTILILDIGNEEFSGYMTNTAVHETLHAVWTELSYSEINELTVLLRELYSSTDNEDINDLKETLTTNYENDDNVITGELFAFVGSDFSVKSMGQQLYSYYKGLFTNRWASINSTLEHEKKIESKIAELNTEYNSLSNSLKNINTFKENYLDTFTYAISPAAAYRDYYTYSKNVDTYNKNLDTYNSRVDVYNSQRNQYNNEVNKFNTIYLSFYPTATRVKILAQ